MKVNDIGEALVCARCGKTSEGCECVGKGGESGPFSTILVNALSRNETSYFNIREEDKKYIKEIRTVYAYNPELGVHLCELTPSHELRFLHTYIVFTDELEKVRLSDDLRDELDMRYCHEGSDDMYMHVVDVRQFAKDHPEHHKECGEFDDMDAACEHLNGNWPF